jgi:molecular chaperone HtpG
MQKVYKYLNREYKVPQKILEINPDHPILKSLSTRFEGDPLLADVIEQIYENALLIEGLHPDPASMINRIQTFMSKSLD